MTTFRENALQNGHRVAVVPVERLSALRADIEEFASTQELNGFQRYLVEHYEYAPPEMTFEARSIICVALIRPSYGEAVFELDGHEYKLYAADTPYSHAGEDYVKTTLSEDRYSFCEASGLFPRKRFAVQAGLAEYGRNNITYVPRLGSYVDYAVFFTDMPPDEDTWRGVVTASACEGCHACEKHCPTGAIIPNRFLIDNTRCLTAMNEGTDETFPPFVPKNAHHTVHNCMRCQYSCPMNAAHNGNTYPLVSFTEAETKRLLCGAPYDNLDSELLKKYELLELKYAGNLPRNLRACFELIDGGETCSLE